MLGLPSLGRKAKKSPVEKPLRQMLVRLLQCHGHNYVTVGDDADELETALSSAMEDRFTDGLREGGAILRHPAATPA